MGGGGAAPPTNHVLRMKVGDGVSAAQDNCRQSPEPTEGPGDAYWLVYLIFLGLGFNCFAIWKLFISSFDYFSLRFPSVRFEFLFAICFWTPAMPTLLFQNKIGYRLSFHGRIVMWSLISALISLAVPVQDVLLGTNGSGTSDHPSVDLGLTLLLVTLGGIGSGVLFSSSFGLAALFPPIYTQSVMVGNGIAGIAVVLLKVVTKVALPQSPTGIQQAAYVYFCCGGALILLSLVGYLFIKRTHFGRHHLRSVDLSASSIRVFLPKAAGAEDQQLLLRGGAVQRSSFAVVFRTIWLSSVTVFINFTITGSLWPGMVTLVQSSSDSSSPLSHDAWFQTVNVVIFTLGDYLGRVLAGIPLLSQQMFPPHRRKPLLFGLVCLRVGFFLFFAFCIRPAWIRSDAAVFVGVFVFSTSNGFFGSLGMMHGAVSCAAADSSLGGTVMSSSLNGGIFTGSVVAVAVLFAVTGNGLASGTE